MVSRTTYFSKKVTLLNVIATFLIVFLHAETPIRFGQPLDFQHYPFIYSVFCLTQIAVPLFFFISAILFYRSCEWKDIPKKLYKRIFSLLIPFVLWNFIFCVIYFTLERIPIMATRMSFSTPLNTPIDWILAIWRSNLTPLWFVKYLMIYCVASPIILLVIKNKWVGLAAIIGSLAACLALGWGYYDLRFWVPIYVAGAWTGRHIYGNGKHENCPVINRSRPITIISSIILLSLLTVSTLGLVSWTWLKFFGPLLIWFGLDAINPLFIGEKFQVKPWMGDMFFIYATHYFLLNVEQAIIRSVLPSNQFVLNLTFIITPVITIVILLVTARMLSSFRFFKVLTGGR
ncbi:MAG: acyltransferase [Bacteroidales bacterium]|nr:acyltransferase [Bacteroidales bacterium]